VAWRIPVFTAAPLPMLYGWRTTCAPAAAASAPVSSLDPSSTTRISCHGATARRSVTTDAIEPASLNAGMTIDVAAGFDALSIGLSAAPPRRSSDIGQQPIDDAVPGDVPGALVAGFAERPRERRIAGEARDGHAERFGRRLRHQSGDGVRDELERAAGVG